MKKLLITLLAVVLLSSFVIAIKKTVPAVARGAAVKELIEAAVIRDLRSAFLTVLFKIFDPGGKVKGRMRRKMHKRFKKNPMDPEVRAIAFMKMKQKKSACPERG